MKAPISNTLVQYYKSHPVFGKATSMEIHDGSGYVQGKHSSGWVNEYALYFIVDGKNYRQFSGKKSALVEIAKLLELPLKNAVQIARS